MHESFLHHRRFRFLKLAVLLTLLCVVLYAAHDPIGGPNGGTWLGYTLGTLGALLIGWLSWLGIRKRRYRSRLGTVKGWVSAHVYFGLALPVIATLHTGFQFGANIHTAAYVLMVLVIASGIYGIVAYRRYPQDITENRAQATRDAWMAEVMDLNEQAIKLADAVGSDAHRVMVRSAENMEIGGSWRQQLFGVRRPSGIKDPSQQLRLALQKRLSRFREAHTPSATLGHGGTMMFMAGQLVDSSAKDAERMEQLLEVIKRRNDLIERLNRDIEMHARMQIWLYLHVPLTCALLAALTAHIVSVFLYW